MFFPPVLLSPSWFVILVSFFDALYIDEQISQKIMWRTSAIECPKTCTFDQGWEDCQCYCNADLMEGRTAAEVFGRFDLSRLSLLKGVLSSWNSRGCCDVFGR